MGKGGDVSRCSDTCGAAKETELNAILRHRIPRGGVLGVEAAAGAGKSTMLREYARRNSGMSILYVVRNVSVADRERALYATNGLGHVKVMTVDAFAYKRTLDVHGGNALAENFVVGSRDVEFRDGKTALLVSWALERFCVSSNALVGREHVHAVACRAWGIAVDDVSSGLVHQGMLSESIKSVVVSVSPTDGLMNMNEVHLSMSIRFTCQRHEYERSSPVNVNEVHMSTSSGLMNMNEVHTSISSVVLVHHETLSEAVKSVAVPVSSTDGLMNSNEVHQSISTQFTCQSHLDS